MALVSKPRPGHGSLGRPIKILANHYVIDIPKIGHFYHYDVEMEIIRDDAPKRAKSTTPTKKKPDSANGTLKPINGIVKQPSAAKQEKDPKRISKDLKRKVMKALIDADSGHFLNGNKPVFDGEKNLYSMKEFKIGAGDSKSADIVLPKDSDGGETKMKVTVKPCSPLRTSWSLLQDVIDRKTNEVPIVVIQCINTVFREAALATGNKIASGRSFFWRDSSATTLGAGRECWPGFYSSARPCQWKMTLNLDVANTAFYEKQSVLTFLMKVLNLRQQQPPKTITDNQRRQFEKEIRTMKVEVHHSGVMRRMRVTGISKETAKSQNFEQNGMKVSVAKYFKDQYKKELAYPDLPLLEVGTKKNFLPMELCELAAGQKVIKKLSDEQTSLMVKMCAKPAPERQRRVETIRGDVMDYDKSGHLIEFDIKVEGKMRQIEGRVLPKPVMGQGHATKNDSKSHAPELQEITVKDMDGTWTQNVRYVTPKNLDHWMVIDLDQDPRLPLAMFMDELITTGRARGMRISPPEIDRKTVARDVVQVLKSKKESYSKQNKPLDLILIIMAGRSTIYADIKKAGDVVIGLPTQVVLSKNIAKGAEKGKTSMNQLVANVLLKMNAKLGGTHSQVVSLVKDRLFSSFTEKPTIIFGADVTHPAPGEGTHKPSIAAVVASYNRFFTQYSARVRAQGHREEMMTTLKEMVIELLQEFKLRCGGREPQRIIFYRDGVSEGQYQQVMMDELRALQSACTALCPEKDYKPPITYIIVGKRHHTRLFAAESKDAVGKAMNVPPGTITDKAICHFSEFDWFLCSHFGIQGTSRPAHYNVLYDDSDYKPDEIQMFSYYLTYCYARCARSVSIPAPAYYAHLAAFRARHHMEDTGDTLSNLINYN